jgi:hypothetical protein
MGPYIIPAVCILPYGCSSLSINPLNNGSLAIKEGEHVFAQSNLSLTQRFQSLEINYVPREMLGPTPNQFPINSTPGFDFVFQRADNRPIICVWDQKALG